MAKRAIILTVAFLLLAVPLCFAQTRAGHTPTPEGQTTFGSIEATGLQRGAPGYICLQESTSGVRYYLWVDSSGDLRIASQLLVAAVDNSQPDASPPVIRWFEESGVAVGDQTD